MMVNWRSLSVCVVALLAVRPAVAQTYKLVETPIPGECFRVQMTMSLSGEMRFERAGEKVPTRLQASATHEFPERVLAVGTGGLPTKMARRYETARVSIRAGENKSEKVLDADRCLIVAQRPREQLTIYCPAGPFTREELELTSEHLDTLAVTGLLPGKAVAVGDTWKVSNAVAQALCAFEGLLNQDLTCKLEAVSGDQAKIAVMGTASGIDLGAMVKLTVQGKCSYDLKAQHVTALEWQQKDERDMGPASPATTIDATTTLTRTALDEQPRELTDAALVSVPEGFDVPAPLLQLCYRDPKGRFTLNHARDWQFVAQTDEHLILRLMENGDFVAQVTFTPWSKAERGLHMTPKDFRELVEETPGLEDGQISDDGASKSERGHYVYRISALGESEGLKTLQIFYLVAGPEGDQMVLYFTLRQTLAEKLGNRDLAVVGGIDFPKATETPEKK